MDDNLYIFFRNDKERIEKDIWLKIFWKSAGRWMFIGRVSLV